MPCDRGAGPTLQHWAGWREGERVDVDMRSGVSSRPVQIVV